MRKKTHKDVEKSFQKHVFKKLTYEPVSGLVDQEEPIVTGVNLETFSRPKASKRERRASLNMILLNLTPPSTPKLDLEEMDTEDIDDDDDDGGENEEEREEEAKPARRSKKNSLSTDNGDEDQEEEEVKPTRRSKKNSLFADNEKKQGFLSSRCLWYLRFFV